VIAGIPKVGWKITKGLEKLAKKNAKKSPFKTHGRDPKGKTKTLCRRILYLQHHVSIKREESGEKEKTDPW